MVLLYCMWTYLHCTSKSSSQPPSEPCAIQRHIERGAEVRREHKHKGAPELKDAHVAAGKAEAGAVVVWMMHLASFFEGGQVEPVAHDPAGLPICMQAYRGYYYVCPTVVSKYPP